MLVTFDSTAELAAKAAAMGSRGWGSRSFEDTLRCAVEGDESLVEVVQKRVDNIMPPMPESWARETVRGPIGTRADMGAWLAGSPTAMRRRVRRRQDKAPLKIVVSVTTSGAVSQSEIQDRGSTVLALLLRMQEVRAIDLYTLVELQGRDGWHYQLTRIESRPLSLSVAAFALCCDSYQRQIGFSLATALDSGYYGGWPSDFNYMKPNDPAYCERRRERLGLGPDDLVIGSLAFRDELRTNPRAWVEAQIAKWTEVDQ